MLLAYIDESYNQDHYWIAALVMPDVGVAGLLSQLDDVVASAAAAFGTPVDAELHGYALFHGEEDWTSLHGLPRARIAIYRDALDAIVNSHARVIIRGLDRKRLRARYVNPFPDHEVVLAHLLERIDEFAENDYGGEPVLVIADEIDNSFEYRRQLWRFQREATGGYRSRQIAHIVDTIYFAPSHMTRMVQAADLVAFLHQRWRARLANDTPSDRVIRQLRLSINQVVSHSHCWEP